MLFYSIPRLALYFFLPFEEIQGRFLPSPFIFATGYLSLLNDWRVLLATADEDAAAVRR